jgi:hypothetical protein
MGQATIRALLRTLLFLTVGGLRRTWDLRRYTGDALALLTGRVWAYGYRHVERFLAWLAGVGGPIASPMHLRVGRRNYGSPYHGRLHLRKLIVSNFVTVDGYYEFARRSHVLWLADCLEGNTREHLQHAAFLERDC